MSAKQVTSCVPVNDSNIPLPKRLQTGSKKQKGFTKIPELQKYIDTIIKVSNEYDSDSTSTSGKDKHQKEKRIGKYSMYKGFNSKLKCEKLKIDMDSNRHKNVNKTDTTIPDAVSNADTTPGAQISGFEDPRNWKFNKLQNSSFTLKVEKFLKELYPNPYHLDSLNNFCDSNQKGAAAGEGMLPEVVISHVTTETQENTGSNELIATIVEENSGTVENNTKSSEQINQTKQNGNSKNFESLNMPEVNLDLSKWLPRHRISNYPSNTSSSLESVTSTAESLKSLMKKTSLKMSRKRNSRDILQDIKAKCSATALREKQPDCDIGKLKLLSMTDSDASDVSKKVKENKNSEKDDFLKKTNSKIYKQEELNDLRKIHEVMNKADESFLLISEKNQNTSLVVSETPVRDENVAEFLDRLKQDVQNEVKESGREEPKNFPEVRKDQIAPATGVEGASESSAEVTSAQADKSNVKSEPEHPKPEPKPVNASKTDLNSSQGSQNMEQKSDNELRYKYSDTSQKIEEVLEFMYDFLMKFRTSENTEGECSSSVVRRIFSANQIAQPSTSKLAYETERRFRKTCPQTYSGIFEETSRKRIKSRCRKSEFVLQSENKQAPDANSNDLPALYAHPELNNEIHIPTVESQNELGGYSEMAQEDSVSTDSSRLPKPIFPLSGKPNKIKADARSLREVLETEEKLFAQEFNPKERIECLRPKELITCKVADEYRITETSNTYSITSGFKCPSSNFVICVNSLPRNLKTFTAVTPVIALPQCPPIPVINVREHREIKPVMCNTEFSLRQFCAPFETGRQALTCTYGLKLGSVYEMNKLTVEFIAVPICERVVSSTLSQRENSLRSSECFVTITVKSVKEHPKVSKVIRSSLTIPNKPTPILPPVSRLNFESDDEKKIEALMQAIEDAEGKIRLLQDVKQLPMNTDKSKNNYDSISNASEVVENRLVEADPGNNIDDKKVHDLLIRTYNLQLKLEDCLEKITSLHPTLQRYTVREKNPVADFNLYLNSKSNSTDLSSIKTRETQEDSLHLLHWYPVLQQEPKTKEEPIVLKIDHGTSYNPPPEEGSKAGNEHPNKVPPADTEKELERNDEDNSSVCSFKSSIDFSEESEDISTKKDSQPPESLTKKGFYKKIYKEIELIKRNFEEEHRQKYSPKNINQDSKLQEAEEKKNSLVQYDTKTATKMLTTVFRGRESTTELTIGLKDIPMTQVRNISVEKTKLSPNHTKIAICISKEKFKEIRVSNIRSEILHNKLPAYNYKPLATSLEGVQSGEEDDDSKTSQSVNGESDDEDDYKSAGSTLEDSDTDGEPDKSAPKEEKHVKKAPKHRFEFYRKMNTNFEDTEIKPNTLSASMCTYKELEPLKQAMTEMQIRMRSIKRDALIKGNDYYERALKLAKMSAGYCQSCGNRAVIPNDTFGYYKTLIPQRYANRSFRHYKATVSPEPSFYSFRSSNADVGEHFCDLDIKHSSYLLNRTTHSNRTILRSSLQDMPALIERM